MRKIEIAAPLADKEAVLAFLQEEEVVHLISNVTENRTPATESQVGLRLSQLQLALDFLSRVRERVGPAKAKSLRTLFAGKPAASLPEIMAVLNRLAIDKLLTRIQAVSERLAEITAALDAAGAEIAAYAPWQSLRVTGAELQTIARTPETYYTLASFTSRQEEALREDLGRIPSAIWQEVYRVMGKRVSTVYLEIIVHTRDKEALLQALTVHNATVFSPKLAQEESITSHMAAASERIQLLIKEEAAVLASAKRFLRNEGDLQFAFDALLHEKEREEAQKNIKIFRRLCVVTGWIPAAWTEPFCARLKAAFPQAVVALYQPAEGEVPPVRLANPAALQPFEAVTNIYGKPAYHEVDPSGALSAFFLVAFGLALTDAGYGLVLMATMAAADKFFRLKKEMRKMVRLLFLGGISTFILGALTGGWFGIALEDLAPSVARDALLSIKLLDPVREPMKLLGVVFAFGIVQLLFAWVVKGFHLWRTGDKASAIIDTVPWISMVLLILAWTGSLQGVLPADMAETLKWAVLINAGVLVATQGRTYKNPFLKVGGGIISLFGLMSFMSDMLSYSRLLALGLATGIIGFVVNLLAGMAISLVPVVGVVIAVGILLVGHAFNLGINALGAFIHSGRLQFVEFFPKFLEGGGLAFKPFGRVGKYVDNPRDFTV